MNSAFLHTPEAVAETLPEQIASPATLDKTRESKKHSNRDEIERLEEENRFLVTAYTVTTGALGASLFVPELFTKFAAYAAGTIGTRFVLKRAQKVISVLKHTKALDEAFAEQGVEIFTELPVPDHGSLDMLVKFPNPPKKAVFAIALRSQGKATIFYNEGKECFQFRRGTGMKTWTPDHIERLSIQGYWLRMNQSELFGTSRNDRNRPLVKVLCLTGETKIGTHGDHLYTQVGDQRVLLIERKSSIFVLEEHQLEGFIQGWLTQSNKPKTPKTSMSVNQDN